MINTIPQDFAKAGFESTIQTAFTMLDGIQALTLLNLNTARSLFETSSANLIALFGAKDYQAFISLQQSAAAPAIEKGLDYSRNVYAITSVTKDRISKEMEAKLAIANTQVSDLVEKALANAPAGSEVAVASIKSAMTAANTAYAGLNKVSKQASELAEASISAATQATLQNAESIARKSKAA